jgi:hypothetical protein
MAQRAGPRRVDRRRWRRGNLERSTPEGRTVDYYLDSDQTIDDSGIICAPLQALPQRKTSASEGVLSEHFTVRLAMCLM